MSKSPAGVFARTAFSEVDLRIAAHPARRRRAIAEWCRRDDVVYADLKRELQRLDGELATDLRRREVLLDGAPARRPRRRMPTLQRIAAFHRLPSQPACVRCEMQPRAERWSDPNPGLERAHIIDRVYNGLDLVSNLLPLCPPCHRSQPIFKPGDDAAALEWFGRPAAPSRWVIR